VVAIAIATRPASDDQGPIRCRSHPGSGSIR
jgi:hypothetical protein